MKAAPRAGSPAGGEISERSCLDAETDPPRLTECASSVPKEPTSGRSTGVLPRGYVNETVLVSWPLFVLLCKCFPKELILAYRGSAKPTPGIEAGITTPVVSAREPSRRPNPRHAGRRGHPRSW